MCKNRVKNNIFLQYVNKVIDLYFTAGYNICYLYN